MMQYSAWPTIQLPHSLYLVPAAILVCVVPVFFEAANSENYGFSTVVLNLLWFVVF